MVRTTCETVQPDLKAYLDKMLPPFRAYRVGLHLRNCEKCSRELAEIDQVGKELHNMASEMSAGGDTLDPVLRARILAAIPTEPGLAPLESRRQFRWKPVMTIGALAAAAIAIVIVLPQGPLNILSSNRMIGSEAKRQSLDVADNAAASSSAKAVNHLLAGAARATAAPMAPPASKQTDSLLLDEASKGAGGGGGIGGGNVAANGSRAGYAPMTQDGSVAAQMPVSVTEGQTPTVDRELAKTPASAAGERQKTDGGVSPIAARNVHTFIAGSLADGEQSVRRAASLFGGSVVGRTGVIGSNAVELTVTVPISQSEGFVAALPRMSGGVLQPQSSENTGSGGKRASGFSDGHPSDASGTTTDLKPNGDSVDNVKAEMPNAPMGGRTQTRAAASPGGLSGGRRTGENKSGKVFNPRFGGSTASAKISIVLVKRR